MVNTYDTGLYETQARPSYSGDGRRAGKKARRGGVDISRLTESMRHARRVLERFRAEMKYAVTQYVGKHYAEGGAELKVPVNLIARYVQVMSRSLVPKCPRVMYSTRDRKNQPAVSAMQEWVNRRIVSEHFDNKLHRWVQNSLFGLSVMKVALGTPGDSARKGYTAPAGVPFAEVIDLDDFVFDAGAKDFSEASFIGHRYRIPLEVAESLTYFDSKGRKQLSTVASPNDYRLNQDDGDERINLIGTGFQGPEERDFEEMVDLWEVYLPRQKLVLTLASDHGGVPAGDSEPLRSQEWMGPDCGPYHWLSMMPVPGNPVSKAPVQDLIDLHEFVNHGYRKLTNQMQRQKEVLPVRGGQVDDANELKNCDDGGMFQCDNADTIKPVNYGGPNPVNANFTIHLSDLFNKMAGNLDLLSGSAPQSKTATQDKILAAGATGGVADMQETVTGGIAAVLDAYSWYWWYHPEMVMEVPYSPPGLPDVGITRKIYPGVAAAANPGQVARNGRYEDILCRVDPYSLVYRTPQERLQFIMGVVKEMMPMLPMLQQQGIQFDAMKYFQKIAEYADEPDINDLFTVAEPVMPPESGGGGSGSKMPAETSREYIRKSESNGDAQKEADMANQASEWGASGDGFE